MPRAMAPSAGSQGWLASEPVGERVITASWWYTATLTRRPTPRRARRAAAAHPRVRVDWPRARERLRQHPVEAGVAGVAEILQAEHARIIGGRRRGAVSPEYPVPQGEQNAEIAVGLAPLGGVMDHVHRGRHDRRSERPVEGVRQPHVGVSQDRHHPGDQHVQRHRQRRHASDEHDQQEPARGEQGFEGMMPFGRREIDVGIGMVNRVKSPQQGNRVHQSMLRVLPHIQQQHPESDRRHRRQRGQRQHSETLAGRGLRHRQSRDRHEQAVTGLAQQKQRDVGEPTATQARGIPPPGGDGLGDDEADDGGVERQRRERHQLFGHDAPDRRLPRNRPRSAPPLVRASAGACGEPARRHR